MDTDNEEQTLFEITERTDTIEKPKRQATQRQLDALAKARQIRAETKQKEQEEDNKLLPAREKADVEPLVIPRLPKTKKKSKPTIIQFQDDSDSDDDDHPTIIIKNKKHKPTPVPPVPVPEPPKPIEPVQQKPRQFIRRAY
jgi:hypothetical protein